MDRIKKKKKERKRERKENHRAKKVRRPIHDFQAILVEAFSLGRESGQHFSDNSVFFLLFLYLLLSYPSSFLFTISFFFSSLTLIAY